MNSKEIKRLAELLKKAGIKADLSKLNPVVKLKQDVIKRIEQGLGRGEKIVVSVSGDKVYTWTIEQYMARRNQLLSVRVNPNPRIGEPV